MRERERCSSLKRLTQEVFMMRKRKHATLLASYCLRSFIWGVTWYLEEIYGVVHQNFNCHCWKRELLNNPVLSINSVLTFMVVRELMPSRRLSGSCLHDCACVRSVRSATRRKLTETYISSIFQMSKPLPST